MALTTIDEAWIGIDLGGTKIEGVVLDANFEPRLRLRVPTERERGYAHVLRRVADVYRALRPHAPHATRIGIGTPGSLSLRDGRLKNANTTCLNGQRLREDLEAQLGIAVRVENDADCFALAEARAGAGREARVVFGVILGTGVGGGIVVDRQIWTGRQRIAGEWGHHRIATDGPLCYCGQRGCVETFLSGPALEAAWVAAGGTPAPAAEIGARARAGEPRALEVLDAYCETFGRALANVVNILDPDVIVLGGGLSNLDVLYERGREAVARHVFNDELRTVIRRPELGDSAGVIGAAILAAS